MLFEILQIQECDPSAVTPADAVVVRWADPEWIVHKIRKRSAQRSRYAEVPSVDLPPTTISSNPQNPEGASIARPPKMDPARLQLGSIILPQGNSRREPEALCPGRALGAGHEAVAAAFAFINRLQRASIAYLVKQPCA